MEDIATAAAGSQHLRALERANEVRLARADLKRNVGAGRLSAAEVVLACPWQAQRMTVSELLMAQRRWGRTRTRRLLMSLGVSENKLIGSLTERQRIALSGVLAAKGHSADSEGVARRLEPAGLVA
jgi:hypothetical protein